MTPNQKPPEKRLLPRRIFRLIRRRLFLIIGVCLAPFVLMFGSFAYVMFVPHPSVPETPLAYMEFTNRYPEHIAGLPSSASNIYLASSSVGLGGRAHLYRFDAPVADCIQFGERLIADNGLSPAEIEVFHFPLRTDFTVNPDAVDMAFLRAYGLGGIQWFDVETISRGFSGFGPPHGLAYFWIDAIRGRVYYYWTT
jgi:hypothetical protein